MELLSIFTYWVLYDTKMGRGDAAAHLVEALCYKPEVRGFNWNFSLTITLPVDSASNSKEYQEYFLGVKAAGAYD